MQPVPAQIHLLRSAWTQMVQYSPDLFLQFSQPQAAQQPTL
jgi:hypothetical protein